MKIVRVKEFGIVINMYEELLAPFENACEELYYGGSKADFIKYHQDYLSEEDAKKVWTAAFYFMAEERQPDLRILENVKCK